MMKGLEVENSKLSQLAPSVDCISRLGITGQGDFHDSSVT